MFTDSLVLWRLHPQPVVANSLRFPLSVGRHAACDLRLQDDDISRFHALIEERDGALVVTDQGSRNGVYVNGRRAGVTTFEAGSTLRLGQTLLWLGPPATPRSWLDERIEGEASKATSLVIAGEPGVGKRTVARRIHKRSGRAGPLLIADSAPEEALLRAATKGTVLCDVTNDFEAIARVAERFDTRLIGITSQPPPPGLPLLLVEPLRNRLDELPGALAAMLERAGAPGTWDTDFLEALACHPFPLNFRELAVVCQGLAGAHAPLGVRHLPHAVRAHVVEARTATTEDLSRDRLNDALTRHKGNVRRVAQELGVQRGQLYRVLAGFGLNPDLYRGLASPADAPLPPERAREERRTSP